MFWDHAIPRYDAVDSAGHPVQITLYAGQIGDLRAPAPPPRSWAARADADVAIWTIRLSPEAKWKMPAAAGGTNRSLYYFSGSNLRIAGQTMPATSLIQLQPDHEISLENGAHESELLLMQGRPIGEPVVQYGPFVMNTRDEIQQAFADYQRTGFGGWPWPADDPVFARTEGRYARHADGRVERAD
jgi:redox-sensitive bicupin YhaK (pirin superfamily)